MTEVFRVSDGASDKLLRTYEFTAGPLRMAFRAANHAEALIEVANRIGKLPYGDWIETSEFTFVWDEIDPDAQV